MTTSLPPRWTAALTVAALTGCAAATAPAPSAAPSTVHDPAPFAPLPAASAHAGQLGALVVTAGDERAHALALALIDAVARADRATLERIVDTRVARTLPFLGSTRRPREPVLIYLLHPRRREGLEPTPSGASLIDADAVESTPLSAILGDGPPPEGLEPTDVLVRVPLSPLGRRTLRHLLPGWQDEGRVLVRGGPEAKVVGF